MKVVSVAKNTSFFTFALIIQKIISFSFFTILATSLMPEDLGKFYLAISFTTIFAIIIDLGLANVLTREIAKIKNEDGDEVAIKAKNELFRTVLFVKIPLTIIAIATVFVLSNVLSYSDLVKQLIYISVISMVLDSFTMTFWSFIRGHHILKYESIGVVIFQIVIFILGVVSLKMNLGLKYLMAVMSTASIVIFFFALFLVTIKFKVSIKPIYNRLLIKKIVSLSFPFALFAVLQRFYTYLDSVLLSALAGDKYVGLYQISFKTVFALQFLPMAFIASLYPAFAIYYKENKEQLAISFERAINYLLIISIPLSFGIFSLADKIFLIFKPEYLEAIPSFRVIILSLIFIFINFPIGALLNACDRQKINSINMAIVLAASVLLNLYLIPKYQTLGASITVLLTNLLMFILGLVAIWNMIALQITKILSMLGKILIAGFVMVLAEQFLKEKVHIFVNILISGIIYVISIFAVGAFSKKDFFSIIRSFKR